MNGCLPLPLSLTNLLLESSMELLMLVDPETLEICAVNRHACARLGYVEEKLLGMSLTDIGRALADVFNLEEVRSGNSDKLDSVEGLYQCADDSLFPVEQSIRRVQDGERDWLSIRARDTSDEMSEKNKLAMATSQLSATLEATADGILVCDLNGHIANMNRRFQLLWRLPEDLLFHTVDTEVLDYMAGRFSYPHSYRERLDEILHIPDGETLDILVLKNGQVIEQKSRPNTLDNLIIGRVFSFTDITQRRHAEADLRIAATAFESQEGMFVTDASNVILKVNSAFIDITGFSAEEAVGQTPSLLNSGRHDAGFFDAMWGNILRTGTWQGEIWNRRKNGEVFPEWLTITAVKGDSGAVSHYVGTLTDITQRKEAEDEIKHLAFYDPLTLLPNRRLLLDRLQQTAAGNSRSGREGALLFIDLDNFKTLNDTLGHDKGDMLLQLVAQRLLTCVREGDTVARLGGDEFVIMLEGLSENPQEAAVQAENVGNKIIAVLNMPYQFAGLEHHSTPSIGITLISNHQDSIDELLKQADLAMYHAKAAGRNTLRFFDLDMQTAVTTLAAMEADLRQAVEKGQFLLYYQAQVDGDGRLTGAEGLVRWQHPRRGLVSPNEFIPLAEKTGLILPLGTWVLETACAQLVAWAAQKDKSHITLAVNVSARQFHHPNFVEQVLAVLDHSGANPHKLKLELTESLMLDNVEDSIAKMTALQTRGVSFSLDDFGTGYSSLSYLKHLPLQQLKIDQSFVKDILTDPNDAAIARTIVALAQSMGLAVIAEGVESEEQWDFLASQGCHAYQGYLFSFPLPVQDFENIFLKPNVWEGRLRPAPLAV